ncbi:YdcH family protein [Chelatococcus asaccharovorans]|uniref:DUF465 domain-containing protein n=1 Tax=Chelatococcus asaccharovorans TaxID=28210 RepID=A0A2V3U8W6_9HYPH|nr:DUF465 domain-containing protein [Chelatococcus asaccharovorans]MBS7705341.1 DUF465 domain-containing protein [Chelatococcus asaccharovorans]PXW60256.1 hypothetical protein C7450_104308 [Chelatococcus asaccharovorans]CAH1654886.1 conserved hypothetical protein [Chelatococcus asaccharovorans]CAH1685607.1 conserved hypothetical protein [Chelatococcus asaccharovorans]
MSLQAHIMELKRRHQALEEEIQSTLSSPSASTLKVAELKRKKLQLKDELEQLQHGMASKSIH